MELQWKYLINQFIVATAKNFKKALKLSNYHDAALKTALDSDPANPDWMLLYNRYHPIHLAYVAAYNAWKNAGGQQQGQTLNLEQMLELLIERAARWDAQVQVVFDRKSPQYKAMFPNGRAPFITGSYITRIQAVQTLGTALATAPATLAALKTEVDLFYTDIDSARDTQEGAKGTTKSGSEDVDNKRIITMTEQYRNLGYFINLKADDPDQIAPFFELSILRNHRQRVFTGTLDPGENEAILVHTFVADDEIRFKITGTGSAQFYLASTPNGTNSNTVSLNGGQDLKFFASNFAPANYGTHRYLTGINNGATPLEYEIELL